MHADQIIPTYSLIEELWEQNPPSSVMTTLQTYIVVLRKSLAGILRITPAQAARDVLPLAGQGYRLNLNPEQLDVNQFDRLSRQGNEALAADDHVLASRLLGEALRLWNGNALGDVHIGPLLEVHKTRLEEMRLSALEQRIEADLRGGLHHELLSELAGLTTQHPLNEHLHAQFMIALFRSGRRGQAVETFLRLQKNLDEELGLGPSVRARSLFQEIIADDEVARPAPSHTAPRLFRSGLHHHARR